MVANQDGVFMTRNIRRKQLEERWDKDAVEGLKFTPWRVREQAVRGPVQEHPHRHKWTYRWTSLCVRTYRHHTGSKQSRGKRTSRELSPRSMDSRTGAWDAPIRPWAPLGLPTPTTAGKKIESKMKQDDVDKARLKESKRKRQEFVSRHFVSDKIKHARIELNDGGKTQGGQPGPSTSRSSSSGEAQQHNSMTHDSRLTNESEKEARTWRL